MILYFIRGNTICSGKLLKEFKDRIALNVNGHTNIFGKNDVFFRRDAAEDNTEFIPRKKFEDGEKVCWGNGTATVVCSYFDFGIWSVELIDENGIICDTNEEGLERYHDQPPIKRRGYEVRDSVFVANNGHLIFGNIVGYEYYEDDWLYKVKSGEREFEAFEKDLHKY